MEVKFLNKMNQNITSSIFAQTLIYKHTNPYAYRYKTVPAVMSMTVSSRADRGLWFETVQPCSRQLVAPISLMDWPGLA